MNKTVAGVIVIIIIIFVGAWYFMFHTVPQTPENTNIIDSTNQDVSTPPAENAVVAPLSVDVDPVREFTVVANNFSFSPNTITVKMGDTVKINVSNVGGTHDLKIDEFNVATPRLGSGQSATVSFTADKTGSFQYYCSVGNHRQMGMWGTLVVE